jgi:hypothetical protein
VLVSGVAAFTVLLIFVGILNWLDYRSEECRPRTRNLLRWYETWVLLFIVVSVAFMWIYAAVVVCRQSAEACSYARRSTHAKRGNAYGSAAVQDRQRWTVIAVGLQV